MGLEKLQEDEKSITAEYKSGNRMPKGHSGTDFFGFFNHIWGIYFVKLAK
jgi:hypothetical protein